MSTLEFNLTDHHDCGAGDDIALANGDSIELEPDEYTCHAGTKGTGSACTLCELRWAWFQLAKAGAALEAAGIKPADVYPEMMPGAM